VEPILNPSSKVIVDNITSNMPQSLLLTGEVGVGLGTVARYIASKVGTEIITILPEKDEKIDLEKGNISVASIKSLYLLTRSTKSTNQIVVIDCAERMAPAAQNTLLKLLEEPGDKVYFILATHEPSRLLPTITSRAQAVEIRPITNAQTNKLLDSFVDINTTKRSQLTFMAAGLPAEITRLANDSAYFDKRSDIMRSARDLLQASTYKKLHVIQKFASSREDSLLLLSDVGKIIKKTISDRPDNSLVSKLDSLIYAYQQIQANGNIRLCMARFVLQ